MEKETNQGISLVKKGQKGVLHLVFSRLGLILLFLVLHLFLLFCGFYWFREILLHIYGGTFLFSAVMVLSLLNSRMDASVKNTWLLLILLLPIFGALLFWYTQRDWGHRALKKRVQQLISQTKGSIPQSEEVMEKLDREAPEAAALARYLSGTGCFPAFENTDVTYFSLGEQMWEQMLLELEQAKHFIFLDHCGRRHHVGQAPGGAGPEGQRGGTGAGDVRWHLRVFHAAP